MGFPVVTPLTPADLDVVMELERVCFKDPWTRRMYLTDLTANDMATYLALRLPTAGKANHSSGPTQAAVPEEIATAGQLVAYGGFWLLVDEAHIATIATHPAWRRCGLGLYLMLALLDAAIARGARTSTLEVRASNLPARRLYEKLGYQLVGRRRNYYRDGEDALLMTTPALQEPAMRARLAAARAEAMQRLAGCFGARFV